jgi:hypothetical protein
VGHADARGGGREGGREGIQMCLLRLIDVYLTKNNSKLCDCAQADL